MHRIRCTCGAECAGKTITEAENARAACHGERTYTFTARPRPLPPLDPPKPLPLTATRRPA